MYEKIDGDEDKASTNHALFRNKAFAAWSEFNVQGQWRANVLSGDEDIKDSTKDTSTFINGTLAAFCDAEESRRGWYATTFGSYAYRSRTGTTLRGSARLDALGPQQICYSYMLSEAFNNYYALISSSVIFVSNLIFIRISEPLVALIGMNYATNERIAVSFTIFMCLFLNSCLVPILLQANFSADYH